MLQVVLSGPHPLTDEGTEKQGKLCWRCRTAVVVVAPATRTSVGYRYMSGRRFFRLQNNAEFRVGKETHNKIEYVVQRAQGLDRQAEHTATLTLASWVLLLLLLLLLLEKLCCTCRTAHSSSSGGNCYENPLLEMSGCRLVVSNFCRISSWEAGNTQQNRVRVQRVHGLDRQAERIATLTLASCTLLLRQLLRLLLLLLLPPPRLLLLLLTIFSFLK